MTIKELVLSIENRPGELARIIGHLYENDVQVLAFWVGAENKKGTLRFIASDPGAAVSVLTGLGFEVATLDVIAARVPDHPGGLNSIFRILESEKVNILYSYPCLQTKDPVLLLEVDKVEEAVTALTTNWINLYDERLYNL